MLISVYRKREKTKLNDESHIQLSRKSSKKMYTSLAKNPLTDNKNRWEMVKQEHLIFQRSKLDLILARKVWDNSVGAFSFSVKYINLLIHHFILECLSIT